MITSKMAHYIKFSFLSKEIVCRKLYTPPPLPLASGYKYIITSFSNTTHNYSNNNAICCFCLYTPNKDD